MTGMSMPSAMPSPSMSGMGGMSGMTMASPSPSTGGMSGMPRMNTASPSPSMGGMASTGSSGSRPLLSGATSSLLGGDAGDVRYPYYLINGRVRTAPPTFTGRPGSGSGSGSSTRAPTPPSASPWAATR